MTIGLKENKPHLEAVRYSSRSRKIGEKKGKIKAEKHRKSRMMEEKRNQRKEEYFAMRGGNPLGVIVVKREK